MAMAMNRPTAPNALTTSDSPPPGATAVRAGDYGIDAPPIVRNLILGGVAGIALAGALYGLGRASVPGLPRTLYHTGLFAGLSWLATGLHMIYGSKVRKLRLRDRLLDALSLRGDEHVLDVGCGRGLMLIGAARRLTTGRAIGLDLWQSVDQSGNAPQTTTDNAAAEGVADRIELHTGDARRMPFPDGHFDLIVSTWALHNIPDRGGRAQAVREIVRVLKPGGRVLLVDILCSREHAAVLRECGMASVRHRFVSFLFLIPSYRVDAVKSAPEAHGG
jgi:SAM-dependent methyltransferase